MYMRPMIKGIAEQEKRSNPIDYVLRVADLKPLYYMLAVGIAVLIWAWSEKWRTGLLVGYLFLILAVTVLDRRPGPKMTYELIPFWSYGVKSLRMEILLNVILFIPVGLLAPGWKTVGLAAGYSMLIELAQLVSFRGLFEFDDVIHNALGTALGVLLALGIRRLMK